MAEFEAYGGKPYTAIDSSSAMDIFKAMDGKGKKTRGQVKKQVDWVKIQVEWVKDQVRPDGFPQCRTFTYVAATGCSLK